MATVSNWAGGNRSPPRLLSPTRRDPKPSVVNDRFEEAHSKFRECAAPLNQGFCTYSYRFIAKRSALFIRRTFSTNTQTDRGDGRPATAPVGIPSRYGNRRRMETRNRPRISSAISPAVNIFAGEHCYSPQLLPSDALEPAIASGLRRLCGIIPQSNRRREHVRGPKASRAQEKALHGLTASHTQRAPHFGQRIQGAPYIPTPRATNMPATANVNWISAEPETQPDDPIRIR